MGAPRLSRTSLGPGEGVRVEVDVANIGPRAGDEVVQLYLRDEAASVTRPLLELKRFRRVILAAGERRSVGFDLTPADLAIWNIEMKRVVEPGRFTVMVGGSSEDIKLEGGFVITPP